ncbi:unnamed protein product [Pedinophyceae sp. YPF-701]|nr:unnamed protein product [Pedinophyceae sp. YPF-701]
MEVDAAPAARKVWKPKQAFPDSAYRPVDFRNDSTTTENRAACMAPKGVTLEREKRRQEKCEVVVTVEDEAGLGQQIDTDAMASKRNHNTVGVGKASGRGWKTAAQPFRAMSEVMRKKRSLEEIKADRKSREAAAAARREVVERRRALLQAERERRRKVRERKEANRKASEVTQEISNPATLKKLLRNKKMRHKVRTADA